MTIDIGRAWGFDMSFDRLTPAKALELREAGMEVFVQCLWTGNQSPATRLNNLVVAKEAGFVIAGYASVSSGRDGEAHMDAARAGMDSIWDSLRAVALDMELPGLDYERHVIQGLARLRELGKTDDLIYTGKGAWNDFMPGKPKPAGSKLWNASWGMPGEGPMLPSPYAGWREAETVGLQFTGDDGSLGIQADRDVFDREFWMPAPPPPIAEVDYVTHITEYFASGKVWEIDCVPPPGVQR